MSWFQSVRISGRKALTGIELPLGTNWYKTHVCELWTNWFIIKHHQYKKGYPMARPREFNTDDALNAAMNVFWAKGYEDASLPDLLDGMGITRGSLYKAFTDKRSLFLRVMQRYEQEAVTPAVNLLADDSISDGLDRIETLFRNVVQTVRGGDQRGCLMCTAAAGPASEDMEISQIVQNLLDQMKAGFDAALAAAGDFASVTPETRAILSDMLVTQYVGIRTLTRAQTTAAQLDASVTAIIALLRARA
ncbi:TetR/AcrR family transcriptional regulator [uncultured Litoreibacter sp.]|uniref:TetR/AcrR family transcriptional regulator n=1 Tax=uncultured Litoreibacter sp. TaxID=1392394 RepID=UPI00260A07A8|nr:TetR/AcrR family transcriptional regulator [uncultured Litoreibacter sp.]